MAGSFSRLLFHLFHDKRMFANVVWNAVGTGAPLLAGVIALPTLVTTLGVERFGVLSLAWVVVGYFSFFDLGLGRAMTQLIAERVGSGSENEVPAIAQTGMIVMAMLGVAGGLVVAALSPWLVTRVLSIPPSLAGETLQSFLILSASMPVVILSTGFRGILEARQRFDVVNIIRAPLGAVTYLGPLVVVYFSHLLPPVVAILLLGRIISCAALAWACVRLYPQLTSRWAIDRAILPRLLSFGGWMTLSNIAGPLLLYAGRMALAIMVSSEAVAYFSAPYDVVISILLIPGIFLGVLFPMFSERYRSDMAGVHQLYRKALLQNLCIVLPLCAAVFFFSKPAISLWINPQFAEHSYRVAQWLAAGVFINSFGYYAQALVQALGRPDLTAKLHVAELVAYIPYMIWLVDLWGIDGAAIAWVVRVAISTVALFIIARVQLSRSGLPEHRSRSNVLG